MTAPDAELQEFAVDPRRAPQRVFATHAADEGAGNEAGAVQGYR